MKRELRWRPGWGPLGANSRHAIIIILSWSDLFALAPPHFSSFIPSTAGTAMKRNSSPTSFCDGKRSKGGIQFQKKVTFLSNRCNPSQFCSFQLVAFCFLFLDFPQRCIAFSTCSTSTPRPDLEFWPLFIYRKSSRRVAELLAFCFLCNFKVFLFQIHILNFYEVFGCFQKNFWIKFRANPPF